MTEQPDRRALLRACAIGGSLSLGGCSRLLSGTGDSSPLSEDAVPETDTMASRTPPRTESGRDRSKTTAATREPMDTHTVGLTATAIEKAPEQPPNGPKPVRHRRPLGGRTRRPSDPKPTWHRRHERRRQPPHGPEPAGSPHGPPNDPPADHRLRRQLSRPELPPIGQPRRLVHRLPAGSKRS